jgi:hypothetical protein
MQAAKFAKRKRDEEALLLLASLPISFAIRNSALFRTLQK